MKDYNEENIDPRSLHNLRNLISTRKNTQYPNSQAMDPNHNDLVDVTRLPISPPPEDEIRIKELTAQARTPKQASCATPSRIFKFPGTPLSFTDHQQQTCERPAGGPSATPSGTDPNASNPNPRKRTRSIIPPFVSPTASVAPKPMISSKLGAGSISIAQSPNPKPRKQSKVHDLGIYDGSGFKRRHKHGTSSESLDAGDGERVALAPLSSQKSPARKKRTQDHGVQDYTPQREQGSSTKRRARVRRSVTPDVRYEPPTEQFTPPRKVVLHVPSSTTSTRSRNPQTSLSTQSRLPILERKVVRVKCKRLTSPFPPPTLDLSKPVPPPSPTDDPLLLVGPPVPVRRSATSSDSGINTLVDAVTGVSDDYFSGPRHEIRTPVRASPCRDVDESRWDIGSTIAEETALMNVGFEGPSTFDATFDPDSDSDAGGPSEGDSVIFNDPAALPMASVIDPDQSTGSHIFHSDDEAAESGEDEGEFTGRFKFYNTPVKQDPPSSATRARRDSWGRPVSPFPFQKVGRPTEEVEAIPGEATQRNEDSPPPSPSLGRKGPGPSTQVSRTISPAQGAGGAEPRTSGFTLSEMEAKLEARIATREIRDVFPQEESHAAIHEHEHEQDAIIKADNQEAACLGDDVEDNELESVEGEVTPVHEDPGCDEESGHADEAEDDDQSGRKFDIRPQIQEAPLDDSREVEYGDNERDPACAPSPGALFSSQVILTTSTSTCQTGKLIEHSVALRDDDEDDVALQSTYGDGDSSDEDVQAVGVVEVSSDDPKAAARAAAILKLHHSYILDGVVAKRGRRGSLHASTHRSSYAFGDKDSLADQESEDLIRRVRRKSIASSGGVLQYRPRQISPSPLARSMFVAPRSPAASMMSPEEALREAETKIKAMSASPRGPRTPLPFRSCAAESVQAQLVTPSPAVVQVHLPEDLQQTQDKVEWTKAHWKRLDTCFTDERLAVSSAMGLDAQVADVDDVEIEAVVNRFLEETPEAEHWDRNMLLRRATALTSRQRAGDGAPPSPARFASGRSRTEPVASLSPSPTFVPPSDVGASKGLPPSLLGPRYAHLQEEAAAVLTPEQCSPSSKSSSETSEEETSQRRETNAEPIRLSEQSSTHQLSRPAVPSHRDGRPARAPAPKRVLSYIGSFLGRGGTSVATKSALQPVVGALPLPPPEIGQGMRGPVNTPAKKPIPKSQAPRELVHLVETQLPSKPWQPPKVRSARELVSLNHVGPPRSVERSRAASGPIAIPGRTRKDSGGSVKDLVKSFEDIQRRTEEEMMGSRGQTAVRTVASVGDLKSRKPWRP